MRNVIFVPRNFTTVTCPLCGGDVPVELVPHPRWPDPGMTYVSLPNMSCEIFCPKGGHVFMLTHGGSQHILEVEDPKKGEHTNGKSPA